MKRRFSVVLALVLAAPLSGAVAAEQKAPEKSQCSVRSSTGLLKVVICPPGLDEEALRVAGQEACGIAVLCNAWIWDDAAKAPSKVPEGQSEIDPKDAQSAVAVWFNDRKGLLMVRRDGV